MGIDVAATAVEAPRTTIDAAARAIDAVRKVVDTPVVGVDAVAPAVGVIPSVIDARRRASAPCLALPESYIVEHIPSIHLYPLIS